MSDSAQQTREIIVRLLGAIGSRKEVEQYLKQYSTGDQKQFAIVKVGGGLIRESLDELASSLTFLQRVGLYPIVIHGAGPQLDEALVEAGIPINKTEGMRITDSDTLEVVRRVMQRENLKLVDALEELGSRARPINTGVFEAKVLDFGKYGWVGEITKVHLEMISAAIRAGALPILTCLGETPSGQIVNINADVAAAELAVAIEPYKIVFLTPTGGLLDDKEQIISSINLSEDYDRLMSQDWLHSGMRLKLKEIKELLDRLPLASSVSITSARDLARELFTHRGAGTFLQRGERVLEFASWEGVDLTRMRNLLETGFGKSLDADYFQKKDITRIYVTESYRATAVITREGPIPYLDKFAVTPKAQGEGLGASVWTRMRTDFPNLYWRSRRANPVNSWYFQQSEGTFCNNDWTVFWYGVDDYEQMKTCVQLAFDMPATFEEPAK